MAGNTDARLRTLAVEATETCAGLHAALPEVLEATAALQNLALRFAAVPDDDQAALRERFCGAEAALPRSIQLVKKWPLCADQRRPANRRAWRSGPRRPADGAVPMRPIPGETLCDGNHALADFNDTKDPNRVPDRRDRYPGLSLTIFDNRRICQHSGYRT